MKKRDLKKKISEAYKAETPDLRSRILAACENEPQAPKAAPEMPLTYQNERHTGFSIGFRRMAAAAICLLLFLSGLSVGMFIPGENGATLTANAETFVYLDVNPSIELQMDAGGKVLACIPANTDAEAILADMQLVGVDMNTAIRAIIGSMYVNGYLTEDANSILVSVDAKDSAKTDALLTDISDKINAVFANAGLECSIIAQGISVDDALKQSAQENGISVGKMHLVNKMVEGIDGYDREDASALADMSIQDLNLICSTRPNQGGEGDRFENDVVHGEIGGVLSQGDALAALLSSLDIDIDGVEHYEIKAEAERIDGQHKMVYVVRIKLRDDDTLYEYKVGCEAGDILEGDDRSPPEDNAAGETPAEGGLPSQDDSDQHSGTGVPPDKDIQP